MLKKIRLYFLFLFVLVSPTLFGQSFAVGIGGDFFNYQKGFLDISASYYVPVLEGLELDLGAGFGIATKENAGKIEADFFVPINLGLIFLFEPVQSFSFFVGTGAAPQILISDETLFYMGPYLKAGFRLKVHQYMAWYGQLNQDLVIGPPEWINNSTRLSTGISFDFGGQDIRELMED